MSLQPDSGPGLAKSDGLAVDFDPKVEDIVAFNIHHAQQQPMTRVGRWVNRLVVPLAVALLVPIVYLAAPNLGLIGKISEEVYWIAAGVVFAGIAVFSWGNYDRALRRQAQRLHSGGANRALLGPQTLAITPQRLIRKNAIAETRMLWLGVERIETTPDFHLF